MQKLTVKDLFAIKGKQQLAQVYVRNVKEAAACEAAGVKMIITWEGEDDMEAVRNAAPNTFFTVALGYGQYSSVTESLRASYRALQIGADAIYCPQSLAYVKALADESIPVVGHVGFIPYKRTWFGGFKAVGKTSDEALSIYEATLAHQEAGAIGVEIEIVPHKIVAEITKRVEILTIGMGSGTDTGVQYLFSTDILGDNEGHIPRHAKVYRDHKSEYDRIYQDSISAFSEYQADVESRVYPSQKHMLSIQDDEYLKFMKALGK